MTSMKITPLFDPGQVVATPGALEALRSADMDARELLRRHVTGDWGEFRRTMPARMIYLSARDSAF